MKVKQINSLIPVVALALALSTAACGRMETEGDGLSTMFAAVDQEVAQRQEPEKAALMKQLQQLRRQFMQACREDVKGIRKEIQASGKPPLQYLKENSSGLSQGCQQALSQILAFRESVKAKRKQSSAG